MEPFSSVDTGRNRVPSGRIGRSRLASTMEHIASRLRDFFFTNRNYLILFFLQGLIVWMAFNWFEIIHRLVDGYVALPTYDYWRAVIDFPQFKALHFQFFWHQHNDHRIIFPEIVFLLDMLLWHGRQFLPLAVSFLCYLFTWAAIAWTLASDHHISRPARATAILLAGIIIGWEGTVSLLAWPFLLQWTLMQAAAVFSLVWIASSGTKGAANRYLVLAIAAAIVVNYSSGNGLLLWPILIGASFLLPLRKRQRGALIVCSVLSVGLYFVGYQFSNSLNLSNFYRHPLYSIGFISSYLSMPFGVADIIESPMFGVYLGLANLAAAIFLFVYVMRAGLLKTRPAIVLFGFYCFALLTAIMTAAGRMNPADPTFIAAKPPRYVTVPLVNWAVLVALALWLAGWRRWRVAFSIMAASFIFLVAGGFYHLNWWVRGSSVDIANDQEAVLSVENNLTVPRLMKRIYPDPKFVERLFPVLRNNHLSIYYKSRSNWLGEPVSTLGKVLGDFVPGSITKVFPVPSGVEVAGWVYDGGDASRHRWIVLVNEVGQIVGFGERFPAGMPDDPIVGSADNPQLPIWIGFVDPKMKSAAYRAYMVVPAGLAPLHGESSVPPFAPAFANDVGLPIPGVQWKADASLSANTLPGIPFKNSPRGAIYSTWSGSDANTGQIASSTFDVPPNGCIIFPVVHGPSVTGLAVNVWNAGAKRLLGAVPMRNWDQKWGFWRMELDADVRQLRITVEDHGSSWGQWVAVGQPSYCH